MPPVDEETVDVFEQEAADDEIYVELLAMEEQDNPRHRKGC